MASISFRHDQYQEFARRPQLVRVEQNAISNQVLLMFYQLLSDYIDGMHLQRYPKRDRHPDFEEEHGRLMSRLLRNTRNDHHHEQILRGVRAGRYDDKEFLHTYEGESLLAKLKIPTNNEVRYQIPRP
jgi:hypothetical protein